MKAVLPKSCLRERHFYKEMIHPAIWNISAHNLIKPPASITVLSKNGEKTDLINDARLDIPVVPLLEHSGYARSG